MDYYAKSAIKTGIVDRSRYANDPIYRDTLNRHLPSAHLLAQPPQFKQYPPEYYAQNRAEFVEFLGELIRWAFVGLTLLALAFVLAAITMAEMPTNAPELNTASYIGLGVAGIAGLAYAVAARRAEKLSVLGLISKTGQGASLAACAIMVPVFLFVSVQDPQADRLEELKAMGIAIAVMAAGLALTLSYRRWMLTGAFALYAAAATGIFILLV
ncbi:MAG: hypothetical protein AAFZ11_03240 [Pseudomonadota bacterium]